MKKIFIFATFLTLIFSNVCFAAKPLDFTLGGLTLKMPYSEVIKIYGEPTSHPGGWAQLVSDVIKYGDDVEIGFLGKEIRYVAVSANNGWKTAAGVYVGMPISKVIEIYGDGFITEERNAPINPNEKYFYYKWSGTKYTWSQVSYNYAYELGDTRYLLSVVVNDDKVTAIELNQRTPEY